MFCGVVLFIACISNEENCSVPTRPRARKNAPRSSRGRPSGNGFSDGVSVADGGVLSAGVVAGTCDVNARFKNFGIGIVNSGAPLRATNVVVAIYIGNAARIKSPNTKPANPRRCMCAKYDQCNDENILKLNRPRNMAHIINTYMIVHVIM